MNTIKNNFYKNRIKKFITTLIILFLAQSQLWAQTVDQINLPGGLDGGSGIAGDIIAADSNVFVYTTQNVLVYKPDGTFISAIPLGNDSSTYGKFAPFYFWPEKYIADGQMMTHNSNAQKLYVLAPNLDIIVINTESLQVENTWEWNIEEENTELGKIQTPMHGFAILKYDNIRQKLFLIINARGTYQTNDYSFHSRSVYLGISLVSDNGIHRDDILYQNTFEFNQDSNKTIFDVEFNDIEDTENEQYNHFYLARRYIVETCVLETGESGNVLSVISKYPDIELLPGQKPNPACPHPGKFTKLLYIHNENMHKIITVPYKIPQQEYEPEESCNVVFHVVDLDNPEKNQSIISPHKRIIDVAVMEGNNDLFMCFGDRNDFFNPIYKSDENYLYDIAYFHYDETKGTFIDDVNWMNSNTTSKSPDDFVKLNIPLRIVKNASNPDNSFFLCKANEIVRFDFLDGNYQIGNRYLGEGCHFNKSTSINDTTYILNTAKSGFEIFAQNSHTSTVQTGFQALNFCPDPKNRKLYIYNNLNVHASEIFYSNLDDPSSGSTKLVHNGVLDNTAVGNMVYNTKQDHVLISKNRNSGGILVLDAQNSQALGTQPVTLQNTGSYPKDMFVSPGGLLYLLTNSRNENPVTNNEYPVIKVFDANQADYPLLRELTLGVFEPDYFTTYNADFCYNPYNDTVYAIVTTNNTTYDPYFTAKNTEDANNKNDTVRNYLQSVLVNADLNENFILANDIQMARQLICPELNDVPEGYQGELVINAGFTDENETADQRLLIYNCENGNLYYNSDITINFNQISFSKKKQKLYGFEGPQELTDGLAHVVNFYQLDFTPLTGFSNQYNFGHYNGQVLNIFSNPYNNKLYVQTKIDDFRLGVDPMKLLAYDMDNLDIPGYAPEETELPNRGHYVELDRNAEAGYYYYPTTFPYIDPYTNKIYLPNGGHSNVSVVEFTPMEILNLHFDELDKCDWLSIPRMYFNSTTNWQEGDPIEDVFNSNRFGNPYQTYLQIKHAYNGDESSLYFNTWDINTQWIHDPDYNTTTYSVHGYKMTMDDLSDNTLQLFGNIKLPNTTFPVFEESKNWIGYFLIDEQNVFDALKDHIGYIDEIWGEDFYCYRPNGGGIIFGPEGGNYPSEPAPGEPEWACSKRNPDVDYGDMIIINPSVSFDGIANPMFYWSNGGFTPTREPRPEPVYFTYTETDDYKPFIIELDTVDNPDEIGAFVGDTCVGACSVTEPDTAVILRAYINSGQEDSVTFKYHYYTKSMTNKDIVSYSVLNEEMGLFEKRSIMTTEGNERAFVSFKQKSGEPFENASVLLNIWPNPADDNINFSFVAQKEGHYKLSLFDVSGRLISVIKEGEHKSGLITANTELKISGRGLMPGIYLIMLSLGDYNITEKIIIR